MSDCLIGAACSSCGKPYTKSILRWYAYDQLCDPCCVKLHAFGQLPSYSSVTIGSTSGSTNVVTGLSSKSIAELQQEMHEIVNDFMDKCKRLMTIVEQLEQTIVHQTR